MNGSRARADGIDALLWLALSVTVLGTIPIGFVSTDGFGYSRMFASGAWHLNPNHLLLEPLGAWWQHAWAASGREPVDVLKLLSALSGGLAAAVFRWGVAPRLAGARWAANHATAWLACSSAFLRLWVSDEPVMIQMPFVVTVGWLALVYLERPCIGTSLALGAAVGLAALTFFANLVIGVTLGVVLSVHHLGRRELRRAIANAVGLALGTAGVAGPLFAWAWLTAGAGRGFVDWLTRYGGGQVPSRVEAAFGVVRSWRGLADSTIRATYGAASSLVDLGALAAAARDRQPPSPECVLAALAFLAAAAVMLHGLSRAIGDGGHRGALVLALSWLAAIVGFGIFWNNSDDQFYFQLAPVFGVLAARSAGARHRRASVLITLSVVALCWNVFDVGVHRVLYPRHGRMAMLEREVQGACLVVYPGFDEPELLLGLSRPSAAVEQISLSELAVRHRVDTGMATLRDRIERCHRAGERVVLVDLFDLPPERNPWKFLRRLGYEHASIARALQGFPLDHASRRVGPFTVRVVAGA